MKAAALRFELHIPLCQSLKEKRAVLRPLIEGLRRQWLISVAEVDHQDSWQRSGLGVAIVAPDAGHLESLIDRVQRYVQGSLEVELNEVVVRYLEEPQSPGGCSG
jgi:hypothetical protein